MALALANKASLRAQAPRAVRRPSRSTRTVTRALLDTQLVIGGATATFLALGRFVFLPYQRRTSARAEAVPKTSGTTYFDSLQQTASFVKGSNDPEGFNIIDVLAWGSLGHAFGYALLAISSNGYNGPFGN